MFEDWLFSFLCAHQNMLVTLRWQYDIVNYSICIHKTKHVMRIEPKMSRDQKHNIEITQT